jgi:hypothetical protein
MASEETCEDHSAGSRRMERLANEASSSLMISADVPHRHTIDPTSVQPCLREVRLAPLRFFFVRSVPRRRAFLRVTAVSIVVLRSGRRKDWKAFINLCYRLDVPIPDVPRLTPTEHSELYFSKREAIAKL